MGKLTRGLLGGQKESIFDAPDVIEDINKQQGKTETQIQLEELDRVLNEEAFVEPVATPEGDPIIDANRERIERQRAEHVSQFPSQESEYETFTPEDDKVSRRDPAHFEEFARLIDEGSEDAAFDLLNQEGSVISRPEFDEAVTTHKGMSSLLGEEANKINFNFSGSKNTEFLNRLNNPEGKPLGDVKSVGEYGKRFLSLQDEAARHGLDQAFTDSIMYTFLHVLKEQQWRVQQRENDLKDGKSEEEVGDKEELGTISTNNAVGDLFESAFNIKNGTKLTKGVSGAIIREIMTQVNDRITESGKPPLFIQDTIKKSDGEKLNTITLTDAGMQMAQLYEHITPTLIPKAVVKVRFEQKLNKEGTKIKKSKAQKKKRDKTLDYGDYSTAQESITYQENVPYTSNTELFNRVEESMADQEARNIIDSKFIGLVGVEIKDEFGGGISYRDGQGSPWRYEAVLDKDGRKILNDAIPTSDEFPFKYKMRLSLSDRARARLYDNTAIWIQDTQDSIFFYDFMIGNDRIYIQQNMGNFQTTKFARALLQTGRPYQINPNSAREVGMHKALILQRAGLEKDDNKKSLFIEDLITKFDNLVLGWVETFAQHQGPGIPIKLLEEANGEWEYLTAVEEAIKFNTYMRSPVKNKPYETKFFTELDGTSNALAWSAVQAGNPMVARLTGLLPKIEGDAEDTYFYTVETFAKEMFSALANSYNGDEAVRAKFKTLWEYLGVKNRGLAKKPLMIFVYGAGGSAIKLDFVAELDKLIADPGFQNLARGELGLTNVEEEKFRGLSGEMMVKAVETNFPDLRAYTKAMAAITKYSLDQGLDPRFKTEAGHILHLGRLVGKAERVFRGSLKKDEEGKINRFDVNVIERIHNPRATSTSSKGLPIYKAVKAAAVSVTHSNDSANMNGGFIDSSKEMAKKGERFYGAQIFDGLMTTTIQAEMAASHLNRWFKKINKDKSNLNRFIETMEEQAKERGVKFDLGSQTVALYNPRTGKEDLNVNLLKLIEKLNKRYLELQKQMAGVDANQFPLPKWRNKP